MSLSTSEKIFIDPKDEITFIVERVLGTQKDKVIIVVPQNSLLMSSLVSVEILFRKIAKSSKLAMIVTEDEYGRHISIRAGFIVVSKVSQISSSLWEEMQKIKDDYLISLNKTLNQAKDELNEVVDKSQAELAVSNDEAEMVESSAEEFEIQEEQELLQEEEEQTEEEIDQEIKEKYRKPRQGAKVIELGGLKILAGGDIKSYIDNSQSDKMGETFEENMDNSFDRKVKTTGASSFTGKDFTRAVSSERGLGFLTRLFSPKRKTIDNVERIEEDINAQAKRRKKMLIIAVISAVVFIVGFYLLAFQFSTVDINLKLKKQDVETSASIVVDLDIEEISFDPLIIPGDFVKIEAEDNTLSKTGTADGKSKKGVKATGLVRILNTLASKVTLPAGTDFTNITNNLVYVSKTELVLEPASTTSDGAIEPYILEDVSLVASELGEDYNIANSTSGTKFKIEGYDTTQISATQYLAFTGGTSEEIISVSQENIDKLKDGMMPDLKKQALEKLRGRVPSGYKLIEQSIVYDETKEPESMPKLNEESTDGKFNLTLQIGISGLSVKSQDLISAVSYILANSKTTGGESQFDVADISDPVIDKVEKNNDNYILTLTSQGSLTTQFGIDEIKEEVAGKTIEQANDYFKFIDSIEEYKVTFSPPFIPSVFQRIPFDFSRINIRTR